MRKLKGIHFYIVSIICFLASVFHLYTSFFGLYTPRLQRGYHLLLLLPLGFLLYPATKKSPKDRPSIWDYIFSLFVFAPILYVMLERPWLESRWAFVTKVLPIEMIFGSIMVLLVIELIRRAVAPALAVIIGGTIIYLFFGSYLPHFIGFKFITASRCIELMYLNSEQGMFGSIVGISATYVALFILFGAFLLGTGISNFFADFARAFTGSARGGPAKVAVVASSLFGTVSGSGVANVYGTGTFTIPMMKKMGYRPEFAGAIEAVASTGGMIMPPMMGSEVFVMAQFLSIPYIRICLYAAIPAVLYYLSLFYIIDLEAKRIGLLGEAKENLPKKSEVMKTSYLLLPIVVLVYLMVAGYSPLFAASWCIVLSFLISLANPAIRKDFLKVFINSMIGGAKNTIMIAAALSGVGIIVSVVAHTGLGLKFASLIMYFSGGKLLLSLIFIAIGALILGCGLPTMAAYILSIVLGGRALILLGVPPIAAHLFCFYFAIISCITPPVALCAYAAASIAKSDPVKTGWEAFKLGIAGFVIPFYFVYHPSLLFQGSLLGTLITTVKAVLIVGIAASIMQNYFMNYSIKILGRFLLGIILILLMSTSNYIFLSGLLFLTFFILGRKAFFFKEQDIFKQP